MQWSIILEHFFFELHEDADFDEVRHFGIETLLNGLFCSGAVMISYVVRAFFLHRRVQVFENVFV